ncbi:MAG TPA: aldo/keto reductase, partial [Actinomycetota bacterium]|nr:aldo/keto reductase [Actinomycetota bacterium]
GVRHRRIGSTDLLASEVGLAVWSLVAGDGARSDEDAAGLLGAALDLGIAYFEATDSDDDGRAEELLGQALRRHRDEVTVATTFGYDTTPRPWEPAGAEPRHDWSAAFAARALDRSLRRLRLEPIDLWLLHHPTMDAISSDELFELLEAQVGKGKIRHYGVALGPGPGWGDEGAAALQERRVAAVETVYNLAEQSPGRDLAALATETGAGLVVRDPLAPRLEAAGRARLGFLERDRGQTLDQALLRFALADPAVATTLPPVRDRDHLAELAGAADLDPPTPEDLDLIAELHAGGSR